MGRLGTQPGSRAALAAGRERARAAVLDRIAAGLKTCPDCGLELPFAAFHVNRAKPDGRLTYCRPCMSIRRARPRDDVGAARLRALELARDKARAAAEEQAMPNSPGQREAWRRRRELGAWYAGHAATWTYVQMAAVLGLSKYQVRYDLRALGLDCAGRGEAQTDRARAVWGEMRRQRTAARVAAGRKRCPRCSRTLPFGEFSTARGTPDGRYGYCKRCAAARQRERKRAERAERAERAVLERRLLGGLHAVLARRVAEEAVRVCTVCCRTRPLAMFPRHGPHLGTRCRDCDAVARVWRYRGKVPPVAMWQETMAGVALADAVEAATEEARLHAKQVRELVDAQRARQEAMSLWCVGHGPHPDPVIRQRLAEVDAARLRLTPAERALRAGQATASIRKVAGG